MNTAHAQATARQEAAPSLRDLLERPRDTASPNRSRQTISEVAEVVEVLASLAGCANHLPFLLAMIRVAAGRSRFTATHVEIGEHLPGDPEASDASKAKRAQRAQKEFAAWQEGESPYRLVTWLKGGGEDRNGQHPMTEYHLPLIEVAAELLEALPRRRGRGRVAEVRRRAADLLERLVSDEATSKLREGVRYPRGGARRNTAAAEFNRALTHFRKGLRLAPDPDAYLQAAWNELGPELLKATCLTAREDLEVEAVHSEDQEEWTDESGSIAVLNKDEETQGGDRSAAPPAPPLCSSLSTPEPFEDTETAGQAVHEGVSNGGHLERILAPEPSLESPTPTPYEEARSAIWTFMERGVERFGVCLKDDMTGRVVSHQELDADELLDQLSAILARNEAERLSVCIRVVGKDSGPAGIIQVDDCDAASLERLLPFVFFAPETSPGSFQAWIDVEGVSADEAGRMRSRLLGALRQQKAEGNGGGYGSLRWPGTLNCKPSRLLPDGSSPRVRIVLARGQRGVELEELAAAGLLAEELGPISSDFRELSDESEPHASHTAMADYSKCLDECRRPDGTPDRSRADFRFAELSWRRGHSERAIAARLLVLSDKARRRPDPEQYAAQTVINAVSFAQLRREKG